MAVTVAATNPRLKRRFLKRAVHVTYSPSHRQVGAPMINTQSTLRTSPDLCLNVSLEVLFGSNRHSQHRDAGQEKEIKKNWDSRECRVPIDRQLSIATPILCEICELFQTR